ALSPLMLLILLLIRVCSGRPVIFAQQRSGLDGKPFILYKFRTMNGCHTGEGCHDTSRVSRPGRLLRRCGLDELPQLVNIAKGDMSFVGPRPLLCEYERLYTPRQACRRQVRPGLTGWAQVNGRNAVTWEKRLELDAWYVENISPRLDGRILLRTVKYVMRSVGVNHSGGATMPSFNGTRDASLLILGAGGHGRVIADAAFETGLYTRIAFLDDILPAGNADGADVIGCFDNYRAFSGDFGNAAVALGDNQKRVFWLRRLSEAGFELPVIIHPRAFVSRGAHIGPGGAVLADAVVVTGVTAGFGCIFNTLSSADHDCSLGDGVHLCPGAHLAGTVKVGSFTTIYTAACVANNVTIGGNSIVAAGAAVTHDIPCGVMAAGVPCVIKKTLGGAP
ncbi:MAG: NeuD/PglB/VioB family sugar acetyltransferase, partial [Clostridia bacterium]|nr:NeuD/PglB/VioB family sugar acetyltransferase [Clostridia bacterium]